MVTWVIKFAPLGIMGLVFESITTSGIESLLSYGKLLAVLIGCMVFVALVVNPIIACSIFGIPVEVAMQIVGVGFIIGVLQDSIETGLNSSTDVLFTTAAEFKEWRREGKKIDIHKAA